MSFIHLHHLFPCYPHATLCVPAYADINRVLPSANAAPGEGETQAGPDKVEPRILIINATPAPASTSTETTDISAQGGGGEMRGGYVGLMNCVFAAQKAVSVQLEPPP